MGSKAEYRSAIRSRKLIKTAFMELAAEKEISKITVKDIADRADINRGKRPPAHQCRIRDCKLRGGRFREINLKQNIYAVRMAQQAQPLSFL